MILKLLIVCVNQIKMVINTFQSFYLQHLLQKPPGVANQDKWIGMHHINDAQPWMDHVCSIYQIKNCFAMDCRFCVRWRAAMTFYLYFLFCHFILCIHTIIERPINYQWYPKLLSELAFTSNIFNTYWIKSKLLLCIKVIPRFMG